MKTPGNWTIEDLFSGRAEALSLFQGVRTFITSLGPVTMEITKTQISFGLGTKFAWVWLPQLWIRNRPDTSITVAFGLDHPIESSRIASSVEPRPGRWTLHVVLEQDSDFDDQIKAWLTEASLLAKKRSNDRLS